jgi:hypothetical protein
MDKLPTVSASVFIREIKQQSQCGERKDEIAFGSPWSLPNCRPNLRFVHVSVSVSVFIRERKDEIAFGSPSSPTGRIRPPKVAAFDTPTVRIRLSVELAKRSTKP